MYCQGCVYYNKRQRNKCDLLSNKKISFECYCSVNKYKDILNDMIDYYDVKYKREKDSLKKQVFVNERNTWIKRLKEIE